MLKHRLTFGSLMFAALAALVYADHHLETQPTHGMFLETLLPGLTALPAGIIVLPVMLILVVLAAPELDALLSATGLGCGKWGVRLAALGGCLATTVAPGCLAEKNTVGVAVISLIMATGLLLPSFRRREVAGAMRASAGLLFATIYLGVLPGFLFLIRRDDGAVMMAAVIAATKMGDSGAYFTGRLIGRHKLVPWLSPAKTWEGLGGAIVAATATFVLIDLAAGQQIGEPLIAVAIGVLIGLVGHAGDLAASLLKRDAGVKDSGAAVPGFGGLIDIFDSLLLVGPVVYLFLLMR